MMTPHASTRTDPPFDRLAVVGAGNMGSGIAQKMATEGFSVTLVDLDDEKVARGMSIINKTLADGVQRGILSAAESAAIGQRITGTTRFEDLAGVDLVVEAVFEDLDIKKRVFRRLDEVCRPDAILATNTSSYAVTDSRPRPRGPSASSDCTTSIIRRRTAWSRSSPGRRPTRPCSPRVAASGGPRQDSDCLERIVRVHRQPVLPAVVDRSGPHARRRSPALPRSTKRPRRRSASAWDRSN